MATTFVRPPSQTTRLGARFTTISPRSRSEGRYGSSCVPSQPQRHHSDPRISTVEAAQAFVKSEELKQAMQNAGVVGAPTIWFTNKV
jgi:hypothetical protein